MSTWSPQNAETKSEKKKKKILGEHPGFNILHILSAGKYEYLCYYSIQYFEHKLISMYNLR